MLERYLRVNILRPGPRHTKKRIYRAAVSQRLRNTPLEIIRCSVNSYLFRRIRTVAKSACLLRRVRLSASISAVPLEGIA